MDIRSLSSLKFSHFEATVFHVTMCTCWQCHRCNASATEHNIYCHLHSSTVGCWFRHRQWCWKFTLAAKLCDSAGVDKQRRVHNYCHLGVCEVVSEGDYWIQGHIHSFLLLSEYFNHSFVVYVLCGHCSLKWVGLCLWRKGRQANCTWSMFRISLL